MGGEESGDFGSPGTGPHLSARKWCRRDWHLDGSAENLVPSTMGLPLLSMFSLRTHNPRWHSCPVSGTGALHNPVHLVTHHLLSPGASCTFLVSVSHLNGRRDFVLSLSTTATPRESPTFLPTDTGRVIGPEVKGLIPLTKV